MGGDERTVRHFLGQEMLEGVGDVRERRLFVDELRGLQPGQGRREVGLGFPGDAAQQPERKFAPDDGRGLKQVFLLAAEQVDAAGQHALHRVGNAEVVQGRGQRHAAQPVRQDALVEQGADHLFDEERRALGLVQDEPFERVERHGRAGRVPEQRVDQFARVVHAQGVEPELAVVGLAAPVVAVARPVVGEQDHRGGRQAVGQRVEERLRLGVQPLQVLENQQQGTVAALAQQQPLDRVERTLPADVWVHLLQGGDELGVAEQGQDVGQPVFQVAVERDYTAGHFFVQRALVVLRLYAEVAAQEFDQRQIRGAAAVGLTERGEHQAGRFREQPEFVEQPRLAHAGLAHHAHDLPMSAARLFADPLEVVDLVLTAHETRQATRRGHLEAGAQRPDAQHFVDVQRPADALDLGRAQVAELEIALGQFVGVLADHDRAGRGQPFQPRGQAGRMADRHVIRMQVVLADRADHDRTAVHADADLQVDALLAAQPLGVAPPAFLHPQRCEQRPLGVVFVSQRCAEQREDAVAHGLCHVALVAMDRVHHELECGVDDRARVFRVEVFDEGHRALDVGEQRGDRLAFAVDAPAGFERNLFSANTVGQMSRGRPRRCGYGYWSSGSRGLGRGVERGATLGAEFRPRRRRGPAIRAAAVERGAALDAELRPVGIIGGALPTTHALWIR